MANTKSAKKRAVQAEKKNTRNRSARAEVRTKLKKARTAKSAGDTKSPEVTKVAQASLDSAARKGIIHPNKAARLKSRLMKAAAK